MVVATVVSRCQAKDAVIPSLGNAAGWSQGEAAQRHPLPLNRKSLGGLRELGAVAPAAGIAEMARIRLWASRRGPLGPVPFLIPPPR